MAKAKRVKQRWEMTTGAWTYWTSYELNNAKATITAESSQWHQNERPDPIKGKRRYHRFDGDAARAETFFRYLLGGLNENASWSLAEGDEVALDPSEDFKAVKPKSADYRYFENSATGTFFDIDRDGSQLLIWRGPIGQRGEESIEDLNWDGEARDRLAQLVGEMQAQGYRPAGEAAAFIDKLAETFGEVPEVYRAFHESGAYRKHNGKWIDLLPQYAPEVKFKVFFDDTAVMDLCGEFPESLLPIAILDPEQGYFLAIDRGDPTSPVELVFSGPARVADSFDAFVKRLFKRRPNPVKALQNSFEKAHKLVERDQEGRALPLLEQALQRFPPKKTREDYYDDSDDLRRALAAAYNLRGVCYRAAHRIDDALDEFEHAMRVMAIGYTTPPKLNHVDTLIYNAGRYAAALTACDAKQASNDRERFHLAKARAYALMALSREDEALAAYDALAQACADNAGQRERVAEELAEAIEADAAFAQLAQRALSRFR